MLLSVALVEIGGGCLLAASKSGSKVEAATKADNRGGNQPVAAPVPPPAPGGNHAHALDIARSAASQASSRESAAATVIERLRRGPIDGRRQIDVADAVGVPVTTLRRIIADGESIRLVKTAAGSRLELVA